MRNLNRKTRHLLPLFAIGIVLFGTILALPKTVNAGGSGLTNLVLGYNNNAQDYHCGPADFIVHDFQTNQVVVSRRQFEWGKLNPPGGVDRWHREVALQKGHVYVITVIRGNRHGSKKFTAYEGVSIGFSARDLGIWP